MFGFHKKKEAAGPATHMVVGLGNPGREYDGTRHNAGFLALDALAGKYGARVDRLKFKSLYGFAEMEGKRVLLLKPQTFMNLSGEAVCEAAAFYKIPFENIIVLYDDVSLDVGRLRIRRKGSHGGHNGIKNIIYLSGTDVFPRVKIGVGKKPHPDYDLADWVLSRFQKSEGEALEKAVDDAVSACGLLVQGRTDEAMNRYNA